MKTEVGLIYSVDHHTKDLLFRESAYLRFFGQAAHCLFKQKLVDWIQYSIQG